MPVTEAEHLRDVALQYWQNALDARASSLPHSNTLAAEDVPDAVFDAELDALNALPALLQTHRERQLASLRENQNVRLSTTRSLPPEVLGRIFQYHARDSTHWSSYHPRIYFEWISVAHVSRHWRRIALHTGGLWSKLHLRMGEAAWSAYIDRSRGCLLSIEGVWSQASAQRRRSALEHFHRIAELRISILGGNPFGDLDPVLMNTAPNLHTLDLVGNYHTWHPVLNAFIVERTPALRSLSLQDIYFPWGVAIAKLEHLTLKSDPINEYPGLRSPLASHTFQDVLHTLQGAHNLQTLTLAGNHVLVEPPAQPAPTITIAARKLILLYDGDPVTVRSPIGYLLSALKAEANLHVRVFYQGQYNWQRRWTDDETEQNEMSFAARTSSALRSHLSSRGGTSGPPNFPVLQLLANHPSDHISFRLGFEEVPLDSTRGWSWDPEGSPSIYVCCSVTERAVRNAPDSLRSKTLKLARSVPTDHLVHLRHLTLTGLCWEKADIVSVFERATGVQSLTVYAPGNLLSHTTALLISDVMRVPAQAPNDVANAHDILFPGLRTLRIVGVYFSFSVRCDGGATTLDEAMTRFLERRRRLGCGLQSLHLDNCRYLDHRFVGLWVAIVRTVTREGAM